MIKVRFKDKHSLDRTCHYCQKDYKSSIILARHIYNKHKGTYAFDLLEIEEISKGE